MNRTIRGTDTPTSPPPVARQPDMRGPGLRPPVPFQDPPPPPEHGPLASDWLESAIHIPIWPRAAVIECRLSSLSDNPTYRRHGPHGEVSIVNLSDPDTFAAARDRLALACGFRPSMIAGGVRFGLERPGDVWTLRAYPERRSELFVAPGGASRELALAHAWRAVLGK